MVIVLCEDFFDAKNAFFSWVEFLRKSGEIEFKTADQYSLRAETSDGLCYIFIDYHFEKVFGDDECLLIYVDDFLSCYGIEVEDDLTKMWKNIIHGG